MMSLGHQTSYEVSYFSINKLEVTIIGGVTITGATTLHNQGA